LAKKLQSLPTPINIRELNLSGGFDPAINCEDYAKHLLPFVQQRFIEKDLPLPTIHTEPGRYIVANVDVLVGKASNIKWAEGENGKRIATLTSAHDNGLFTDLGNAVDFYYVQHDGNIQRLAPGEITASLQGRACADFDKTFSDVAIPDLMAYGTPEQVDRIVVVFSGAGAYSERVESNTWCGVGHVLKMDYNQFVNIADPAVYQQVKSNTIGSRALDVVPGMESRNYLRHSEMHNTIKPGADIQQIGALDVGKMRSLSNDALSKLGDKIKEWVRRAASEKPEVSVGRAA
jgi:hypothetical protein